MRTSASIEPPDLSVIIVNWNGKDLLAKCLSSLEQQSFRNFECLVIDNGSTDDSVDLVCKRFPWVRVIRLDQNYGFAGGNNRGIAQARSKYLVLLNNDTESTPGFLQALYEAIEQNPDLDFCATRMIRSSDRSRVDSCGIGLRVFGNGYPIGAGCLNDVRFDRPRNVFGACGGAGLYRRGMLDDIGFFDEDFISHVEDTDLAWRAQLAGYRCLYVPGAIVYHIGGATSQQIGQKTLYRIQRNQTWAYLKNMPLLLFVTLAPLHFIYSLYWIVRATWQGSGGVVWRAKLDAIRAWRVVLAKRRLVQAKRRVSAFALITRMSWSE